MSILQAAERGNGLSPLYPHGNEPRAPYNLEAEQALLGALLINNQAAEYIPELAAAHFFDEIHGRIFDAMSEMLLAGRSFTATTLAERFRPYKISETMNGAQYLGRLMANATTLVNVREYARTIIESYQRRQIILLAEDLAARAFDQTDTATPAEIIEDAEKRLYQASNKSSNGKEFSYADVIQMAVDAANKAYQTHGENDGVKTGFSDLDAKLGGLANGNLIILAGRPSMGKAQPLSAKVLLRDGTWKPMGQLRMGDDLASTDGSPSRVAGVFPQGKKQIYRITLGDGRATRACGDHLWRIESSKLSRSKVVSTDTLRKMLTKDRYQRRISLPLVSGHFGCDDGIIVDPWFLGAMIGNGCMTGSNLSISTADAATLFRVQNVVGHDCVSSSGGSGYDYRLRSGSGNIREAMKSLGLYGKGSPEKFIPACYMAASHLVRIELLRGLLDTDGWVEKFGVVRYATSSPQLAVDVQALVRSLGGSCTISSKEPVFTDKDGKKCCGLTSYVCNIRHSDRASLISLKRKQRRCENVARFKKPTIVSIEPDGFEEAQCIRVTHPSSLYVTDDYIVTHNTALALNIAGNVAKTGDHVHFFSQEMTALELGQRQLSEHSEIASERLRRGEFDEADFRKVAESARRLSGLSMTIDETGANTIGAIATKARRIKRKKRTKLIIIDYLQIMGTAGKGGNRVNDITEITVGLKALAKELDVPIIALSQLNRDLEKRENKRPQLSDLRESGSIEQDADVVMFVYRDEYYIERTMPDEADPKFGEWLAKMSKATGKAEVIIGKQRHGSVGTVFMAFDGPRTRFADLAHGAAS